MHMYPTERIGFITFSNKTAHQNYSIEKGNIWILLLLPDGYGIIQLR